MRGYIKERGKSSWAIWIDIGADPETGKRRRKTLTIHGTKRDAQRELRKLLTQLEDGGYVPSTKMTVGQWLEEWIKGYAALNTAPRTHERYREIVQLHLAPALGRLPLTELRPPTSRHVTPRP